MPNIHFNSFAQRQVMDSGFTSIEGDNFDEIIRRTHEDFNNQREGYRDGVILVPLSNTEGMFSGVKSLNDGDELVATFKARREGETPRISIRTKGRDKMPAQSAYVVLYASTVLAEDGSNELDPVEGNYEVVSINGAPEARAEMPIDPFTLMHNHFGSDGGTDTNMSDAEFVSMLKRSFEFWKDKALCE